MSIGLGVIPSDDELIDGTGCILENSTAIATQDVVLLSIAKSTLSRLRSKKRLGKVRLG